MSARPQRLGSSEPPGPRRICKRQTTLAATSSRENTHRMKCPAERIENQAHNLQRHNSQQWLLISRLPQHHRCVAFALRQHHLALRDAPLNHGPVGQTESHISLGDQAYCLPHHVRDQGICGSGIYEEANVLFLPFRAPRNSIYVSYSHRIPEDSLARAAATGILDCGSLVGSFFGGTSTQSVTCVHDERGILPYYVPVII